MSAGPVEVTVVGSGLRIEPVVDDQVVERDGRLVIVGHGPELSVEQVADLRHADQK